MLLEYIRLEIHLCCSLLLKTFFPQHYRQLTHTWFFLLPCLHRTDQLPKVDAYSLMQREASSTTSPFERPATIDLSLSSPSLSFGAAFGSTENTNLKRQTGVRHTAMPVPSWRMENNIFNADIFSGVYAKAMEDPWMLTIPTAVAILCRWKYKIHTCE